MRWILVGALVGLAATLIGFAVHLSSSSPLQAGDFPYPRSTPQEALDSMWHMLERGDVHRLPDLVHAESDEMRSVLLRLGRLLANVQTLAKEIQTRYPAEVEELRAKAEAAAASGEDPLLNLQFGRAGGRRGPGGQPSLQTLFADPFGALERSRRHITVLQTADNIAAIMVDGKPAFGLGVVMRRESDAWSIVLPLNLPFVARYMPKTRDEWMIVASMVQVIDNAVVELASDVRAGSLRDIEAVSQRAGEKAWIPMVMCILAYNKAMESRDQGDGRAPASPGAPRTQFRFGT